MARKKKEMDNLAKDAAAALAAGMSYGKWKAMQEEGAIERKLPKGWRVCLHCGKPFKPTGNSIQKYCEYVCQRAAADARSREKAAQRQQAYRERKKAEAAK